MLNRSIIKPSHLLGIILVFMAIIPGPGLSSCSHGNNTGAMDTITLGLPALEQNALIYVAEARHFFTDNGLEVKIKSYDTGMTAVNGLIAGEVDIAGAAEFPFARQVIEKQPLNILAVIDKFENDYLTGRKDRGINDIADLKGKRIGVIKGTVLEFFLGRFLEVAGISSRDVTIVDTLTTVNTTKAIISGDIDAAVAFQPYANAAQKQLGDNAAKWSVQNGQLAFGILVADADWLTGHDDVVRRFLKSLSEAEDYLDAQSDKAQSIVQNKLFYDSSYINAVWPLHQFSLSLDFSLILALNDEARWMMDNGIIAPTTIPDYKNFIYTQGLKEVKPEVVSINR